MTNYCLNNIVSALIGELGIVKVLESLAERSYNQIIRKGIEKTVLDFNEYTDKLLPKIDYNSCSCPGCTGRG